MKESDQQAIVESVAAAADTDVGNVAYEECEEPGSRRRLHGRRLQSVDLTITTEITIPLVEASNEQTSNLTFITQLAEGIQEAIVKKITAAVVDGSFVSTLKAVYEQQATDSNTTAVVRTFSVSRNITASSILIMYPPSPEPTIAPTNAPTGLPGTMDTGLIAVYTLFATLCAALLLIGLRYMQLTDEQKRVHPDDDRDSSSHNTRKAEVEDGSGSGALRSKPQGREQMGSPQTSKAAFREW